jgi:hypothetical protein
MRVLAALLLLSCSAEDAAESQGGHTNWLTCARLADCAGHPDAVRCEGGFCLDANGARLAAAPGSAATDGATGGSDEPRAGRGSGDSGSNADAALAESAAGAGSGAGAGGAGSVADAGTSTSPDAAATPDAGGVPCGSATCVLGQVCCDHCLGVCIPAQSGAFCIDDIEPNRSCDDAGTGPDPNATSLEGFFAAGANGMLWGYNTFEADGGANALSLADSCIEATESSLAWRYAITYHVADVVDRELYGYLEPSAPIVTLAAQEPYAVIDGRLSLRARSEGMTDSGEAVAFRMTGTLSRITR